MVILSSWSYRYVKTLSFFLNVRNQDLFDAPLKNTVIGSFSGNLNLGFMKHEGIPSFFFQFCDVAEVVIIHNRLYSDLATY
jgi:hypothetical protein